MPRRVGEPHTSPSAPFRVWDTQRQIGQSALMSKSASEADLEGRLTRDRLAELFRGVGCGPRPLQDDHPTPTDHQVTRSTTHARTTDRAGSGPPGDGNSSPRRLNPAHHDHPTPAHHHTTAGGATRPRRLTGSDDTTSTATGQAHACTGRCRMPVAQRLWRSTALSTARSEAVIVLGSMPTPQSTEPGVLTVST